MVSDCRTFDELADVFSLNPCSNGIWSLTIELPIKNFLLRSLNPCSNGIWSLTVKFT